MIKNISRFIRKWRKDDAASTSVEFAMVGLGFILMMVGVIEIGRMIWTDNVVDYTIDETARYAVLHQDASPGEVESFARGVLNDFFVPPTALQVTVNTVSSGGIDFIEIQGDYTFESLTSGLLPTSLSQVTFEVMSRRPVYSYD